MESESYKMYINEDVQQDVCTLCRCSNGPFSFLFPNSSADITRSLIIVCLELKIKSNDDKHALACTDCLEKVRTYSWFYHQAKSNDSFLKMLPDDSMPARENFCRLCLTACSRLEVIFPDNNSNLCEIIQECVEIEINPHREFNSHICHECRTHLELLTTFKRICKQINARQEECKESCSVSDDQLLEIMNVKSKPKTEIVKRKHGAKFSGNTRKDIYVMLRMNDDERNFEVVREFKGKSLIKVNGYNFYMTKINPDGSSQWFCEWRKLHNCKRAFVTLGADTKIATFKKVMTHTHGTEPDPLLNCPSGKGYFTMSDGSEEPFWLVSESRRLFKSTYKRYLLYDGHKYLLSFVNTNECETSWTCNTRSCEIEIKVYGIFKSCSLMGTHKHPKLSVLEINRIISANGIKDNDALLTSARGKTDELQNKFIRRARVPDIYAKLALEDVRNFDVFKVRENLFKIRYMNYFYKYFSKAAGGRTVWKCIWESIHNCSAMVIVSEDCRDVTQYELNEHCHSVVPAEIFQYELKHYFVRDFTTEAKDIMQLLSRDCTYFESRSIISQNHAYNLCRIADNLETRWSCVRQPCPALLILNGLYSFFKRGEHSHAPFTRKEEKRLVDQKNKIVLSSLELGEEATGAILDESHPDTLRQLLSFPLGRGTIWDSNEHAMVPFFFLIDNTKNDENPHKVLYQQYRYSFASINACGTSQWICCKLLESNTGDNTCTAYLTIEGMFQKLTTKGTHNHAGISESMINFLSKSGKRSNSVNCA
ncbi:uncharacterized protein LOC129776424 [Toxorhynchites rutilus septentrionalis]|uniref:uncharacterized protein LOC129776424 n=1 Tax=Toxorhynchites rutilus septentrionalis TaxID=329112 RepID=UPI002479FF4F|nr:uncharacterized protein LOC129776424 [Toxorhynchites rutilus septentrionalis]